MRFIILFDRRLSIIHPRWVDGVEGCNPVAFPVPLQSGLSLLPLSITMTWMSVMMWLVELKWAAGGGNNPVAFPQSGVVSPALFDHMSVMVWLVELKWAATGFSILFSFTKIEKPTCSIHFFFYLSDCLLNYLFSPQTHHCWSSLYRVTTGELAKEGYGKDLFLGNEELEYDPHREVQYLKDDTLRFRVIDFTGWSWIEILILSDITIN